MACTQILHILQTDFEGKNSCKEILYLAKKAVPTLKKISLLAYDSGKNPTARPLYVRKKKFYHQRVWGKTFFPRQITHTTHSPSMSNGRLFLLFLCCSGPLFRSLPNVPLFLCSSCFVPCQHSLRTADVSPRSSPLRDVLSGDERGETSAVRRLLLAESLCPPPPAPPPPPLQDDRRRRCSQGSCFSAPTVPLFLCSFTPPLLPCSTTAPLCPNPPRINNSRWPTHWPIIVLVINTWLLPLVRRVDLTSSTFSAFKQLLSVGVLTQRKMDLDRETNIVEIPRLNIQWDWKEALRCVGYIPVNSKPSIFPPGIARAFDWSFAPCSGEFDPN